MSNIQRRHALILWPLWLLLMVVLCAPAYAQSATPAAPPRKLSKPPKCALVGTWRGNITVPDGADGVPGALVLRFSGAEDDLKVTATMSNKAISLQNQKVNCSEFSAVSPGTPGVEPLLLEGKLAEDGQSLSGTAKRQNLTTTWTLQRK